MATEQSNDNKVICPKCCHQFGAIPVSAQRDMIVMQEEIDALKKGEHLIFSQRLVPILYDKIKHMEEFIAKSPADRIATVLGHTEQMECGHWSDSVGDGSEEEGVDCLVCRAKKAEKAQVELTKMLREAKGWTGTHDAPWQVVEGFVFRIDSVLNEYGRKS